MPVIDISHLLSKEDYRPLKKENVEQIDLIGDIKKMCSNNETVDIIISGRKGDGKSTCANGLGKLLDPYFSTVNVCFDKEEFIRLVFTLPPGSVIVFDEGGTQESGMSSRKSMSSGNQDFNDVWRKVRTKGLIIIVISPDIGEIDKRIRETFRFMCTPVQKLNDEDTNGYGMAVKCMFVENYKEYDDTDLFRIRPRFYKGIKYVTIPSPDAEFIYEYEKKRDKSLNYSLQMAKGN